MINLASCVFGSALEGFKHKVELTNIRKVAAAAFGAGNFVLFDVFAHLSVAPTGRIHAGSFDKLVGAVACFTLLAIHKGVGKSSYVT